MGESCRKYNSISRLSAHKSRERKHFASRCPLQSFHFKGNKRPPQSMSWQSIKHIYRVPIQVLLDGADCFVLQPIGIEWARFSLGTPECCSGSHMIGPSIPKESGESANSIHAWHLTGLQDSSQSRNVLRMGLYRTSGQGKRKGR